MNISIVVVLFLFMVRKALLPSRRFQEELEIAFLFVHAGRLPARAARQERIKP